jgi:cytochrome P450
MTVEFEPFDSGWRNDPYPVYRQLRDEAPVQRSPGSGTWCVSRYDDVLAVLKDPESFSSRAMFSVLMNGGSNEPPPLNWEGIKFIARFAWRTRLNPLGFGKQRMLIAADGEAHGSLRTIVNRGFTPRQIAAWEPRVRALTRELLAPLHTSEPFDVVHDLAIPLPVTVVAEMLGVEPERMRDFKHWSDEIISGISGPKRTTFPDPPHPDTAEAIESLAGYLAHTVRLRRRSPGNDLVSTISAEQEGDAALTTFEVVQFVMLLLIAGNETTTNLIGNAVCALLDHPSELASMAQDPSRVPLAIEETLRWNAPIQMIFRSATRDTEVAGTTIPKGATVAAMLGSANRDERRFEEPDRFRPERDTRGHLGFGFGAHFCLGAALARLEAVSALAALAPELPRLACSDGERAWVDSFLVRGPTRIPLQVASPAGAQLAAT